ncbi:hypothetical protein P154DRAFT_556022 [Amniculicola lignicola CBS 123094]|uniref:Uncharacterized protein n=1 Tax=Amniculicola lignicola CBS 123094 TaxID=1392246 RepID=A0A6A5WH98_9PLEO|nr:hypothetical protein P154DRAFT_556022 [Amniculicola lignicola CBS 123094]
MFRRTLLRAPRNPTLLLRRPHTRPYTSQTPPPPPSSQTRIERFNRRLPRFLHKHTSALSNAPLTHISAFLLLHELTAIIPLFTLAATFHYTNWLPPYFAEGTWVVQGVERFGKYFRKKGWIRGDQMEEAERDVEMRKRDHAWNIGEGGVRVVVEFATAYAVTKVLLPVRIVLSVWGTPWFARTAVIPVMGRVKRLFGRGKGGKNGGGVAGTGAVDAGVVPKTGVGKGKDL